MADTHRTLAEIAHYPEHGPRPGDPQYRIFHEARRHMIDVLGVGCWIGGATKTQIEAGLPADHLCYGCKQLEAHHHIVEWASLAADDWQKVAADFPTLGIHSDDDLRRMAESEGGLLILCDIHHRGPLRGIHAITEPVWKLQRYERDDWRFIPTVTTAADTSTASAPATVVDLPPKEQSHV